MLFESYVVKDKDATHIPENLNGYCGVQEAIAAFCLLRFDLAPGSTIIYSFD